MNIAERIIYVAMKWFLYACVIFFLSGFVLGQEEPRSRPLVLAHYMPWYDSKAASGAWGWHWTMNHFKPDEVRWNGRREAAMNSEPLIGLYDSGDPDALASHVLQMKLAGIDGVIIDWYGIRDFNDYKSIHENTGKLIPILKRAGLKFAICFEDQTMDKMFKEEAKLAIEHGKEVMGWLENHWFSEDHYLKVDGRPVLTVFGPQYFSPPQWAEVIDGFKTKPKIYTLPHLTKGYKTDGSFGWVPVTGGKTYSVAEWTAKLDTFYSNPTAKMGIVFPGFKDVYQRAKVSESYGHIAARKDATFLETLDRAFTRKLPIIQIATWNDHGEGTGIEPTQADGYRFLEILQTRLRDKSEVQPDHLRLPVEWYRLRKSGADSGVTKKAMDLMFANDFSAAKQLLKQLRKQPEKFVANKQGYRLINDIAYREPDCPPRCTLDLYYPVGDKPYATVVWLHGGGIQSGYKYLPEPLLNKGIAVATVNYRLNPNVSAPTYVEDTAAAVAWVMKNIESYGSGRADAVFVSGHSAGGYLVSLVALDKKYLKAFGEDADKIAGLAPFSGQAITHFTVRKENGIGRNQPVIDAMAPLFHCRKDAPPILIGVGDQTKELIGRYEENVYFWKLMQGIGHPDIQFIEFKGYNHGNMPEPAFEPLLEFIEKRF